VGDANHEQRPSGIKEQVMNELTKAGIRMFQAGDRQKAARLFARAVQLDVRDEEAWYWLSACVDDIEKKRYCLQRVLQLNPQNVKANRRLNHLEGYVPEPETQKPPVESHRRSFNFKVGAMVLAIVILVGGFAFIINHQERTQNEADLAAVLSAVDGATALPVEATFPSVEPTEVPVFIPVTGIPLTISGNGAHQTEEFHLPAGELKIFWQYNGSANEDQQLQASFEKHQANLVILGEKYQACLKENQILLDFAIRRQQLDDIAKAESDIELCIQVYQQESRSINSQHYDEIDYYSTSFTVIINRSKKDGPAPLVNVQGLYYGKTTFKAEEANDYYLTVDASGPWSITFVY
jgi:tetratricopeptide (TPR) repeat protein